MNNMLNLFIPAPALGLLGLGRLLVLSHFHLDVLVALSAEGVTTFGHVNHDEASLRSSGNIIDFKRRFLNN